MSQRLCYGCMQMVTEDVCPHCGTAAADQNASDQLPVGTLLRGQYLVGRVLGQGGFGITYIGLDTYLDEVVAIKEFFPTSAVNRDVSQTCSVQLNSSKVADTFAAGRDRFLREAKILAKLRGIPEIVDIRSMFPENNTAYIIMEYVRGIDLREYVRRRGGKLSVEETLKLLEPIAYALDMVHQEELVHRDVSPDNIMLQPKGRTKLLDFGASRGAGDADADRDLTHSTEAILKHGFAPMEQYRSRGNLGPWTDEYSFCATIYYCLTGKVPPEAPVRITDDEQPQWERIEGLTERQRAALEKGMAMRAKDRFESMEKLHRALYAPVVRTQIQPKPKPEPKPVPKPAPKPAPKPKQEPKPVSKSSQKPEPKLETKPAQKPVQRKKSWFPMVLAVVLAVMVGLGWMMGSKDNADQKNPAEPTTEKSWEKNILKASPLAHLGIHKSNIKTVTFLDTLAEAPSEAVDVSADGTGSVKAWYDNGNVYIGANGGVNGSTSCESLFNGCTELVTVNFGGVFHTDQTTSVAFMFAYCENLVNIDVAGLDVSNVTNMASMFYNCQKLNALEIGDWDVSNVTNMASMFYVCQKLNALEIGDWDVSNVTNMADMCMFGYFSTLDNLELRNWDVSNVIHYEDFMGHGDTINGKPWEEFFARESTSHEEVPEETTTTDLAPDVVGLALEYSDITVRKSMSYKFKLCNGLTAADVEWSSMHPHIASVDENGVVKALKEGTTIVIVKYGDQEVSAWVRVV